MFSDLFSSLDCGQIGWASLFLWATPIILAAIFFSSSTWVLQSGSIIKLLVSTNSDTRMKSLLPLPLFLFSLMFFLIMMNLSGLVPFVYGVTSNMWVASSMAITMWGLLILSGWVSNPKASLAHLAPAGAPSALVPFLVLVESVSVLIRPLTLTVRLVANISAGHIVMSLIANCLVSSSGITLLSVFAVNVGYNLFEVFVCLIQAYIFSLLVKLYAEEHPSGSH